MRISRELSERVDALKFEAPIAHVYNPLAYARAAHEDYLLKYGSSQKPVVLLGMNPGPFGMAQTGVPFGDVRAVRDFLKIERAIERPAGEHPKRPILGFACARGEVSGARLWGWAEDRFGSAEAFFETFFVVNYCPLAFMEASCRNRTPDKLPPEERAPLFEACDAALRQIVETLGPSIVVGIGSFAEKRARTALSRFDVAIGCALHPSPASPAANRGWAKLFETALRDLGIRLPD